MDAQTQRKWDRASRFYDFLNASEDIRFRPFKKRLFGKMRGATLMVGVGTGRDIKYFPPGLYILAIDISPKMLERAARRAIVYSGSIELRAMDVCDLNLPDSTYDTIVTACTFCSVPQPVTGLRQLHRVLKPGGRLLMFEHVRSGIGPLGIMLDLMTPISSRIGPVLNRDTVNNVERAGFRLQSVENVYLDIVKTIEAVKD